MQPIVAIALASAAFVLPTSAYAEGPVSANLPSALALGIPAPDARDLSRATLEHVVRVRRRSVTICYERSLKRDNTLRGRITVLATIRPSGRVARARVASRTLEGTQVARCIERAVAKWRFPSFTGRAQDILLPFALRRG